jgi:hypothetical protein
MPLKIKNKEDPPMSTHQPVKGTLTEFFETARERLKLKELSRAARNGRQYVQNHPGVAVAAGITAGFALGYLTKAIVRHRQAAREVPQTS